MPLHIGFSGSRYGMTHLQKQVVRHFLRTWASVGDDRTLRHGCCAGADQQANDMAIERLYRICAHPGPKNQWCRYDQMLLDGMSFYEHNQRKDFHPRNVDIVMKSNVIITTPNNRTLATDARGGTWYTTRVAIERGRPTYVVLTDGTVHKFFNRKHLGVIIPADQKVPS